MATAKSWTSPSIEPGHERIARLNASATRKRGKVLKERHGISQFGSVVLLSVLTLICALSNTACQSKGVNTEAATGSTVTVPENVAANFSGHWKGTMLTKNHHDGTMELTLVRTGNELKASAKFYNELLFSSSPIKNLKVTGDEIYLSTNILGADVQFNGKVVGEKLGGTLEAFQRRASVDTGNWDLTRTPDKP
jgi:hypothetical protein